VPDVDGLRDVSLHSCGPSTQDASAADETDRQDDRGRDGVRGTAWIRGGEEPGLPITAPEQARSGNAFPPGCGTEGLAVLAQPKIRYVRW
jgi:hypothetical protein